jgi:hypothetical protein
MVKLDTESFDKNREQYLNQVRKKYEPKGYKFKSVLTEEKNFLGFFKKSVKYAFFERNR